MRIFRKIRWVLTILTLLSTTLSAQVNNAQMNEGVLRVKLKAQLSSTVSNARLKSGNLSVGHSQFDAANQSVKAYRMQRMFPYNEKFEERYKKHGLDRWYEISFDKTIAPQAALSHYTSIEDVEIAEPAYEISLIGSRQNSPIYTAADLFNDPYLYRQWHYNNDGTEAPGVKGADINLFKAWEITAGRPDVIVSIVDGGIDVNHNDLKANMWINEAELNGTPGEDSDGNGYIDDIYGANFINFSGDITPHEHGTHVAGTVAATNNNGLGVAGVAGGSGNNDGVKIMSCQVFDSKGLSGNFARAIVYGADNGAVICQNSWGYNDPEVYEQVVLDAIDYFTAEAGQYPGSPMQGGVVIFAAGNNGLSYKYYPGAYKSVISVAAMGPDYKITSYSNYGDWVDITAPGGESGHGATWGIFSTYPDNRYTYMDGTSMACPHVSGIAALVVSKYGSSSFTNTELKQRLLTATQNIEKYNPDYIGMMGNGYIDAVLALSENESKAPAKVTDLSITGIAQDFAQLKWTAVTDEDDDKANYYQVYYSKSPITASTLSSATMLKAPVMDIPAGESIDMIIEGLNPLTTYHFAVMAFDRWHNASELSNDVSATTNEGPKFVINSTQTTFDVNVAEQPEVKIPFIISNEAAGLLRWEASLRHVSQSYSTSAILKPEVNLATSIKPGQLSKERVAAEPQSVRVANSLTEQEILRYGIPQYYMIGSQVNTTEQMAAIMFITSTGFNLTDIYAYLKHDNENGPMRIDIIQGNVLTTSARVYSQEITSTSTGAYQHRIQLDEQIYLPRGAFWINIIAPKHSVNPFGIGKEDSPEESAYNFFSADGGKSFTTVEDAMRMGGFTYPETAVWDIAAVSNNRYFGEYIVLSPASGTVAGNESATLDLIGNGSNLIQGSYKSNLTFKTNDVEASEVKHPISFNITGQKPSLTSEKIVNFNDVFVTAQKTLSIEVANEGLAPFSIQSITSSNPVFKITNYNYRISAHGSIEVKVQFAPKAEGSQSSTITLTSKTGETHKFSVYGIGCIEGELAFNPAEIDLESLSADVDKETTVKVTMTNVGKYPLEYAFLNYVDGLEGKLAEIAESQDANAFGYSMETTLGNKPNNTIKWQEHASNVVDITNKFSFTEKVIPLDLGFSFPLFTERYDTLYITDSGALISNKDINFSVCYPASANASCWQESAYISGCGFRMKFNKYSEVKYSKSSGKAIISYENVGIDYVEYMDAMLDLEIVIYENGNVDIIYRNLSYEMLEGFGGALIAVANEFSTDPYVINEFGRYLNIDNDPTTPDYEENMAFRIYHPGSMLVTSVSEPFGMIQIGESKELTLNMSLKNLSQGDLKQNINILTTNSLSAMAHLKVKGQVTEGGVSSIALTPATDKYLGTAIRTTELSTSLQISNKGNAPLTVDEVSSTNDSFTFEAIKDLVIQPNSTHLLELHCNTTKAGSFADDITIKSNDTEHVVRFSYDVIAEPIMEIDREFIDTTMVAGAKGNAPFIFTNKGESELKLRMEGTTMVYPSLDNKEKAGISYIYKRSDEDRTVIYNWVDRKSESLHVQSEYFLDNSTNHFAINLPFKFEYYGVAYDKLWVHKCGFVSFDELPEGENPDLLLAPRYIGRDDDYNNFIAPMWGYHSPSMAADPRQTGIFVYKDENQVIIHWGSYSDGWGMSPIYDFQLILGSSNSMKFQYKFTRMPGWTKYVAGLENKDASDALIISNGNQVLYESMAIEVVPAQSLVIPAKETKVIDFTIDGSGLYANSYYQQVKLSTNDPREDVPACLTFAVELEGKAEAIIPESVEFGEVIISRFDFANKSFNISNDGTAEFEISQVNVPIDANIAVEVYDKFTTPWGSFEDYFPIEDVLPLIVTPKQSKEFRISWLNNEPSALNTEIELITSEGTKKITITGSLVNPPALEISNSKMDVITNTEDGLIDKTIVLSNKNGESTLKYEASIEYKRTIKADANISSLISPMASKNAAELTNCEKAITASTRSITTSSLSDYHRVLDYLEEDITPSNFLGFGKDLNFIAATSFTAPANGFQLSHVQTWYRPGDIELSNIYAYILVGNKNPGRCDIIGSGRLSVESPGGDKVGSYITVELDDVTPIYPGEIFHVMFVYPLGSSNPQGHATVLFNKVEYDRYFYADGGSWYDIANTSSFFTTAYMMRALEKQEGEGFWVMSQDEMNGQIVAGDEKAFKLQFNSKMLKEEISFANLNIVTNDPANESTIVPISFSMNTAPVVTVDTSNGAMQMSENQQKEFTLIVVDKEGDSYELELAEDTPAFVELHKKDDTYSIFVNADYEAAGIYSIEVIARDSWGRESNNALRLEITNVNRVPEFKQMDTIEIGEGEFSEEINLNDYFTDADNDALKYECTNNNPESIRTFLSDGNMLVKGIAHGIAYINVKATDPWGASAEQQVRVNVNSSTGIKNTEDADIFVTPNPVITTTIIGWGSIMKDEVDYAVFSNAGSKVMAGMIGQNGELDLRELERGVYYLMLDTKDTRKVVKLIKQ